MIVTTMNGFVTLKCSKTTAWLLNNSACPAPPGFDTFADASPAPDQATPQSQNTSTIYTRFLALVLHFVFLNPTPQSQNTHKPYFSLVVIKTTPQSQKQIPTHTRLLTLLFFPQKISPHMPGCSHYFYSPQGKNSNHTAVVALRGKHQRARTTLFCLFFHSSGYPPPITKQPPQTPHSRTTSLSSFLAQKSSQSSP